MISPISESGLMSKDGTKAFIYSTRTEVRNFWTFLIAIYTKFGDDLWIIQDRIQAESNSLRLSIACYGIIFVNASR